MNEQLDKYFLGALSDTEKKELFDRIESNPDDKAEFVRMQNTITISKLGKQNGDTEWASRKMEELGNQINHKKARELYINLTKYAAVIAILLVNIWLLTDKFFPTEKASLYTKIEVPKGQRIFMTLQDGTEAWLSPRSVIRIPNEFSKTERSVELDGEGFFSVTKDAERPFVVKTRKHNIKVLGTRFNVFAYSESQRFETDLLEGRVEIINNCNPSESVILSHGEKATWENDRLVTSLSIFNNEEYLKNGIFSFSNKPFKEILDYLSLWYNVKFDLHNANELDHPVSGKFRQSDEVKNILKALQGVHHFNYKIITDEHIEIY